MPLTAQDKKEHPAIEVGDLPIHIQGRKVHLYMDLSELSIQNKNIPNLNEMDIESTDNASHFGE